MPKKSKSTPVTIASKLGTKFLHIPTKRIFILRAITDSKTLAPTRYLWCKDTEEEHFNINPSEWKLYDQHIQLDKQKIN